MAQSLRYFAENLKVVAGTREPDNNFRMFCNHERSVLGIGDCRAYRCRWWGWGRHRQAGLKLSGTVDVEGSSLFCASNLEP
jgi:hypothetical protein